MPAASGPIAFRAKAVGSVNATTGTVTFTDPGVAGDLLFAVFNQDGNIGWGTSDPGWSSLGKTVMTFDGQTAEIWYKKQSVGGGGTITFTGQTPNVFGPDPLYYMAMYAYSGCDPTNPINVLPVGIQDTAGPQTSTWTITSPSVGPTTIDGCMLVSFIFTDQTDTGTATVSALPSGYTQRDFATVPTCGFTCSGVADKIQATAGATGAAVWTVTLSSPATNAEVVGYMVALAPAPGGGAAAAVPPSRAAPLSALDSWSPLEFVLPKAARLTAPNIASVPPILPSSTADRLAVESWTPDEVRRGPRPAITASASAAVQPPASPQSTTRSAVESWSAEGVPSKRAFVTTPSLDAPPPVGPPSSARSAAETWVVVYGATRAPAATAGQVDAPAPRVPFERIALDSWLADELPALTRARAPVIPDAPRPMVPVVARPIAETWTVDYGWARRPLATDGAHDAPPPRGLAPWAAAVTWQADDTRAPSRFVAPPSVDQPPPSPGRSAGPASATWTPDDVQPRPRGVTPSTPPSADQPPPRVPTVARSASETWTADEQRPRAVATPQPPTPAQAQPAGPRAPWGAAATWDQADAPPARPRAPAPSVDAPTARAPFARAAWETWGPSDDARPRPPAAPQSPGSVVDSPPPRGPLATIRAALETWLTEYGATRRPTATAGQTDQPPGLPPRPTGAASTWQAEYFQRAPSRPFTPSGVDQPPPRAPAPRAAVDTWDAVDARLRPLPAPPIPAAPANQPPPIGSIATLRTAFETWLVDFGSARRPTATAGQLDQPPPFTATATLRGANESWTPPETRLPPRYQPQLPPPTNQPTPIGNVNTLRALLDSWLMDYGWTRRPLFTAGQADQPVPLPWTSTSDRVAFESWTPPAEPARGAGPRASAAAPNPPAPPAASFRAAVETWVGELAIARRAAPVVPGSVDAPSPRGPLAAIRTAVETWLPETASLRRTTAVPGSIDQPAPISSKATRAAADTWTAEDQTRARARPAGPPTAPPPRARPNQAAVESWTTEGAWVRRPTAPPPPPVVDNPTPWDGGRVGRAIAHATWVVLDYAKPFRPMQGLTALAVAAIAHLRRRARPGANPTTTHAMVNHDETNAVASESATHPQVNPGRTRITVGNGKPTKSE